MPTGSRNIQAVVPAEVHHGLREVAYKKSITLKELTRQVLIDFYLRCNDESQIKKALDSDLNPQEKEKQNG